MTNKYAGKSDNWKRSRAVSMAKTVLKNLHHEEYRKIYEMIVKEEFGVEESRDVVSGMIVTRRIEEQHKNKPETKPKPRWLGETAEHYG